MQLQEAIAHSVEATTSLNTQMRLLALNARIEATHAGSAGRGFSVVAAEMVDLAQKTQAVFRDLESVAKGRIDRLAAVSQSLHTTVRGTRLADLAHTNVDLVDRCLYERTCDVRWWATDGDVVHAVAAPSSSAAASCSARLGVILRAYTVYHDILVCTLDGRVVANGRRERFPSMGRSVLECPWFSQALRCTSGDEFSFTSAHRSDFVGGAPVLAYACQVRQGGSPQGALLGVLCVLFNWGDFAQRLLTQTALPAHDRAASRISLFQADGIIVADSHPAAIGSKLPLADLPQWFTYDRHHAEAQVQHTPMLVGFARSPGFETYATGWGSVIMQPL